MKDVGIPGFESRNISFELQMIKRSFMNVGLVSLQYPNPFQLKNCRGFHRFTLPNHCSAVCVVLLRISFRE